MEKTAVLGVSGGITIFEAVQLISNLIKEEYDVEVTITQGATKFITPLTFESLTKYNVMVSTFEKVTDRSVKRISITHRADIFVLVPATANVIAKIIHGLIGDMLTATLLTADCPKVICLAINAGTYEDLITQKSLGTTKALGYKLVEPEVGYLACRDIGKGELADITRIEGCICRILETIGPPRGKHVLTTTGPTREALDPVRFISNHSSRKMSYETAGAVRDVGANVTLISGPVQLNIPYGVRAAQTVSVQDMLEAVQQGYADCDIVIKAAAVDDYRVQKTGENKIRKRGEFPEIIFVKNPDILAWLGKYRALNQIICGSAMEAERLLEHVTEKLNRENCDVIITSNLHEQEAGFQRGTNVVALLQKNYTETLDLMDKYEVGVEILTRLTALSKEREEA